MGLAKITGGEVRLNGLPARIRNPYDALRTHRIGYVSEDRKDEGLVLAHSISRNVGITIWDRNGRRLGWISDERARPVVLPSLKRLNVRMSRLSQPVGSLSGGNQQKVSAAKWIAAEAELLIFDEPTVGIDVAAKDAMRRLIIELAEDGKAIFVISSDLHEVVQLSDRILVMGDFCLLAELENSGDYASTSELVMRVITRADPVLIPAPPDYPEQAGNMG
jgi:ribose transport system ATP-binding protein